MVLKYQAHEASQNIYLGLSSVDEGCEYNICFSYKLDDLCQANILVNKLKKLVKQKAYLRQTFHIEDDLLFATVNNDLLPNINYLTINASDLALTKKKLLKQKHNIREESAVILTIIKVSIANSNINNNNYYYIAFFNIHHIITDGVTLDNFIDDLNNVAINSAELIEKNKDLSDELYIKTVSKECIFTNLNKTVEFQAYYDEVLKIKDEVTIPTGGSNSNFHAEQVMPVLLKAKILAFATRYNTSVFNVLLSTYGVFLAKLLNNHYSLVYYPVNIRKNQMIDGCFISSIAFPTCLKNKHITFNNIINKFISKLDLFKSLGKYSYNAALLSSNYSFAYSNVVQINPIKINQKIFPSENYIHLANSALSFKYCQRKDQLIFSCDAKKGVLNQELVETLLPRFFHFIERVIDQPNEQLGHFDLVFTEERDKLLHYFQAVTKPYPANQRIEDVFDQQVNSFPNNIAIIYRDQKITYKLLSQKVNLLAEKLTRLLRKAKQHIIALALDSRLDLIIYMIAILKNHCYYLVLDISSINARTAIIINEAAVSVLITSNHYLEKIKVQCESHCLPEIVMSEHLLDKKITIQHDLSNTFEADHQADHQLDESNLAHLIYTSGTTGIPKGVMVSHRNIISLVKNPGCLHIDCADVFAFLSDPTFDASTFEIWSPLLNGATLFIPDDVKMALSSPKIFFELITKNNISVLWLTKSLFDQLYQLDHEIFSQLNYLFIGGEALNKFIVTELAESAYAPKHIINGYGPTENTTFSCFYSINAKQLKNYSTVPIGRPLHNRTAIVLDNNMNFLPFGATGDLYVGGEGLALGYWRNNELTAKKFTSFSCNLNNHDSLVISKREVKLYKTGDLARLLPDGNIECLGRNDFQVKIRGYRIELSGIEKKLMAHTKIQEVAVLSNRSFDANAKEHYLIAYYVAAEQLQLDDYLIDILPDYMHPRLYIHLDQLPKKNSGKLNFKALPKPDIQRLSSDNYVEPVSCNEHIVCKAFADILHHDRVSVDDDFFLIGGDSIKVIALISALQESFIISVTDIFKKRTPRNIAKNLILVEKDISKKLEHVQLLFQTSTNYSCLDQLEQSQLYQSAYHDFQVSYDRKEIKNLLLTGVNGYLGCNLLFNLLSYTDYYIFSLIRGKNGMNALERLEENFKQYFNVDLKIFYGKRLTILTADISSEYFGLDQPVYYSIAKAVDSVLHAAALTKHYGDYDEFYQANVKTTINLLEFCLLTRNKDFHHMSTISVLHNSHDANQYYTEDDCVEQLDQSSNFYIKTKHEAEKIVVAYRKKGLTTNIYRLGNLAFMQENSIAQINKEDNAFYNRIKSYFSLNLIADKLDLEEITPVDLCADAIVRVFDKKCLSNGTYHLVNSNLFSLSGFFEQYQGFSVKKVHINEFLTVVFETFMSSKSKDETIARLLLSQGWLNGEHNNYANKIVVSHRTDFILEQLGFEWPKISNKAFFNFVTKNYPEFRSRYYLHKVNSVSFDDALYELV